MVAAHTPDFYADSSAIRTACPGLLIVEDAANVPLSRIDSRQKRGDIVVHSLGPGKPLDAGEGGLLATDDPTLYARAVAASQHPIRQLLVGLHPDSGNFPGRIHPVAAAVALHALVAHDPADTTSSGRVQ